MGAGLVGRIRMYLAVPTGSELGSSTKVAESHNPTALGVTGLGTGTRRLQEVRFHLLPPTHYIVRGPEAGAGSDHEDGKCGLAS